MIENRPLQERSFAREWRAAIAILLVGASISFGADEDRWGKNDDDPFVVELANVSLQNGAIFLGRAEEMKTASSLRSAGDMNGDGYDDVIIGATGTYPSFEPGEAYVVFGSSVLPRVLDLDLLDGVRGFRFEGVDRDAKVGSSVSSIGDFNGDGFDDVIIGAGFAEPDRTGAAYVVYGAATFPPVVSVEDLDGANGFALLGENVGDNFGTTVKSACDLNQDGFGDLFAGAYLWGAGNDYWKGRGYVVYGGPQLAPTQIVTQLPQDRLTIITGAELGDRTGLGGGCIEDINGDGLPELAVPASGAEREGEDVGETTILFGRGKLPHRLDLAEVDSTQGFKIRGQDELSSIGGGSYAGDFNGDGYSDFSVVSVGANGYGGETYLIYGALEFPELISTGDLDGSNGVTFTGELPEDLSGGGIYVGDVNSDGYADIGIGALGADPNGFGSGRFYLVFGAPDAPATIDIGQLNGETGIIFNGAQRDDHAGGSFAAAGDFNGDGVDDFLVGAPDADSPEFDKGAAFLILGPGASGGD